MEKLYYTEETKMNKKGMDSQNKVPKTPNDQGYLFWVQSTDRDILRSAVFGGYEVKKRERFYIGRAKVHGNVVPGKVDPQKERLYTSWQGSEACMKRYEVLTSKWNSRGLQWIACSHGQLPIRAIQGGQTRSGEPLYIARALTPARTLCVGTFHPARQKCYIPWKGQEVECCYYEILCHRSRPQSQSYIYTPARPLHSSLQVYSIKNPLTLTKQRTKDNRSLVSKSAVSHNNDIPKIGV